MSGGGTWPGTDDAVQPEGQGESASARAIDVLIHHDPALVSHWAAGRSLPAEVAVAEALAIDPVEPVHLAESPVPLTRSPAYGLSPREHEVLDYSASG